MFQFDLGIKAKDTITGLSGTITARSENISGTVSYWLTPPVDDDGNLRDGDWVDENRISSL